MEHTSSTPLTRQRAHTATERVDLLRLASGLRGARSVGQVGRVWATPYRYIHTYTQPDTEADTAKQRYSNQERYSSHQAQHCSICCSGYSCHICSGWSCQRWCCPTTTTTSSYRSSTGGGSFGCAHGVWSRSHASGRLLWIQLIDTQGDCVRYRAHMHAAMQLYTCDVPCLPPIQYFHHHTRGQPVAVSNTPTRCHSHLNPTRR